MVMDDFSINISRLESYIKKGKKGHNKDKHNIGNLILFNNGLNGQYDKGLIIEPSAQKELIDFLNNKGISQDKVNDASFVTLDDGTKAILVGLKSKKGNTTTLLYNANEGTLLEFSTLNKQGVRTTMTYDGNKVKGIQIEQKNKTIIADGLGRATKVITPKSETEYTYIDNTKIPSEILEKFNNGSFVQRKGGQKIYTSSNGKTKITKDDLTSLVNRIANSNQTSNTSSSGTSNVSDSFSQKEYSKYGVNLNYRNDNSVVSNKYHKGDPFQVIQNGKIITIKNKRTNKIKTINLEVLLKNFPSIKERAKIIKKLQSLPGEVLMDLAVETTSLQAHKEGKTISVGGGNAANAAAFYDGATDTIHVDSNNSALTLVHELGHAVDYSGTDKNTSSVMNDKTFISLFNQEMRNYLSAGNKRYTYTPDGKGSGSSSTYATANEKEMFAECYTLLMMGNCNSKAVIEKYFPKTLAYINSKISNTRSYFDTYRHHR